MMSRRRDGSRFRTALLASAVLACGLLLPSELAAFELRNSHLTTELRLLLEYDDNANLASTGRRAKSDLFLKLKPRIELSVPRDDHEFFVELEAGYRYGLDTEISDLNLSATSGFELVFPGGLELGLTDTYRRVDYDQALQEEAGTPASDSNLIQLDAAYTFVERLEVAGGFSRRQKEFHFPGGRDVSDDVDRIDGRLDIPVSRSTVVYAAYSQTDQESAERPDREYVEESYRVGGRWSGPNRFTFYLEVGRAETDFELPAQPDFEETTVGVGAEVKVTDSTAVSLSLGLDGYGETAFSADFAYNGQQELSFGLSAAQLTQPSFSFVFESAIFQSRQVSGRFSKGLSDRFVLRATASYQLQESFFSDERREDEVVTARLAFDYPVQNRLRLGAYYQRAERSSKTAITQFDNNRMGFFVVLVRGGDES